MAVKVFTGIPVLVVLAGCGGGTSIEGDTYADQAPDSVADTAVDPVPDALPDTDPDALPDTAPDTTGDAPADVSDEDVVPPGGITFEIGFVTDIPGYEYLFVQSGDLMGMVAWISVLDSTTAAPIALQARCDICTCEQCMGCGVCGVADPVVTMVGSGSSTEWTWDGVTHPVSTCRMSPMGPDIDCQEQGVLAPGAYTARFCWGLGSADAYPDDLIESPACADVAFTYPVAGGRVTHVVNNGG